MAVKHSAKKNGHTGEAVAISAGVAALAAASYYFLGPKGEKHRRQLKSWSIKMKGDVVEKLEKLQDVSEPVYRGIVDAVAAKYVRESGAARSEIEELAEDLKRTWRSISSSRGAKPRTKKRATGTSARAASKKHAPRKRTT
jgi:hypothetical protein